MTEERSTHSTPTDETSTKGDYTKDHERTFRDHAGEAIEDGRNWPGYVCIAGALGVLGMTLTAAGYGFEGWAWMGAATSVVLMAIGLTIVLLERKRVNNREGRDLTDPGGH